MDNKGRAPCSPSKSVAVTDVSFLQVFAGHPDPTITSSTWRGLHLQEDETKFEAYPEELSTLVVSRPALCFPHPLLASYPEAIQDGE
jgi:hypothetical protein